MWKLEQEGGIVRPEASWENVCGEKWFLFQLYVLIWVLLSVLLSLVIFSRKKKFHSDSFGLNAAAAEQRSDWTQHHTL